MNKKTNKVRTYVSTGLNSKNRSDSGVNSGANVGVFVGHDIGIWSNSGEKSVDSSVSGHCGWFNQDSRTGEDGCEWSKTGEDYDSMFDWMEPSDWGAGV